MYCKNLRCADARRQFCELYGNYCAALGRKVCLGDCPSSGGGGGNGGGGNGGDGAKCASDDFLCQASEWITKNPGLAIVAALGVVFMFALRRR